MRHSVASLKFSSMAPSPYFFHVAFAPSFIWCGRPGVSFSVSFSVYSLNGTTSVSAKSEAAYQAHQTQHQFISASIVYTAVIKTRKTANI